MDRFAGRPAVFWANVPKDQGLFAGMEFLKFKRNIG
jgi:hypothetical protein